eukprot:jgi/Hompol1/6789/HPOL_002330-RA
MDGNTPPVIIVYQGIDIESETHTVAIVIGCFTVLVLAYVVRELINLFYAGLWRTEEQRQKDLLDQSLNTERFIRNFHQILSSIGNITFELRDIEKTPTKLIPHAFILLWVISIIIIHIAIGDRTTDKVTGVSQPEIKMPLTQIGLFLFFVAVNGFLVDRMADYYRERTDNRKKAQAAHLDNLYLSPSAGMTRMRSKEPNDAETSAELNADRHDIESVAETSLNEMAAVQVRNAIREVIILIVEFIQLASFPLRDLFRNPGFQLAVMNINPDSACRQSIHGF